MKKKHINKTTKNAHRLTIDDALEAMENLVRMEHYPEEPCKVCKKVLRLLEEIKNELDSMAVGDNLVYYAYKGVRRLAPQPDDL